MTSKELTSMFLLLGLFFLFRALHFNSVVIFLKDGAEISIFLMFSPAFSLMFSIHFLVINTNGMSAEVRFVFFHVVLGFLLFYLSRTGLNRRS